MYADMLAFAAKFEEEGTPLDIVKTPLLAHLDARYR